MMWWRRRQLDSAPPPQPFYSLRDRWAAGIAAGVAFVGYCVTLAPGVTLEDSGELITAAHHLGVPHPPGYPAWTLLAWLWQVLIPFGNIAWRVNLFSAVCCAAAVGMTALLAAKSGRVMMVRLGLWEKIGADARAHWLVSASAVTAGLLLAFSPVMWSQAVIAEVYGLNALVLMLVLAGMYRWSFEPERMWRLYLAGFLWGVGMAVHQTVVLLAVALPVFVRLTQRELGRAVLAPVMAVIVGVVVKLALTPGSLFYQGLFPAAVLLAVGGVAGMKLRRLWREGLGGWRRWVPVGVLYLAVLAGLSFYLYGPMASATNPPMNWGYTRTWAGFVEHFTRGQYEKLQLGRGLLQFWGQLNMFLGGLAADFTVVYALVGLVGWLFFRPLTGHSREWLKFLLVAFLSLGFGFLFLANPSFERQQQFTDRVFFLTAHGLYALWIGYGLMLGVAFLCTCTAWLARLMVPCVVGISVLPVVSVVRHWADSEQQGHDFGYRYGYGMFVPGGGYAELPEGAVLLGGSDPGRFIASYMIFVESQVSPRVKTIPTFDRRDVYLVTQNALADPSYLRALRDQYGAGRPDADVPSSLAGRSGWENVLIWNAWRSLGRDQAYPKQTLWLPSEEEAQQVFQGYVERLRGRPSRRGEEVSVEGARVRVRGVVAMQALNGTLARMIFENNKNHHAFYVEDSELQSWMYAYAEPAGIILRLNREPLSSLEPSVVARDRVYWDELSRDLLGDRRYRRDEMAQHTFATARATIGSVYAYRGLVAEAGYAFQQALALCPVSSPISYRLAQLYARLDRLDEAQAVLERAQQRDRFNAQLQEAVAQVAMLRQLVVELRRLEQQHAERPDDREISLRLLTLYGQRQRWPAMDTVTEALVSDPGVSSNELFQIAAVYGQLERLDRVAQLLKVIVERYPDSALGWYNLAFVESQRSNCFACIKALSRALALDSQGQLRAAALADPRLANCRADPLFQRTFNVVPSAASP